MKRLTGHPLFRWLIFPVLAALVMLTPIYDQYHPVYREFHVTSVQWVPGGLELWGVLDKQRSCSIKQRHAVIYFRGEPRRPAVIKGQNMMTDQGVLLSRFLGRSAFGPWRVEVPSSAVAMSIYSTHDCWWWRPTEREEPVWRRGS